MYVESKKIIGQNLEIFFLKDGEKWSYLSRNRIAFKDDDNNSDGKFQKDSKPMKLLLGKGADI